MKYAVIAMQGHQYRVEEGQEFLVDKIVTKKPEADVLLVVDGDKVKVGTPKVRGAKITLKVLEEETPGKKLYVRKFKAKSKYRKKIGFRPKYTKLQVGKITV